MKKLTSILIRLLIVAGLAWYFSPSYMPPKAATTATPGSEDSIQWKICNDPNPQITQSLTVYGDGRARVVIYRPMGDKDLPDGGGWKISRDPETQCVEFVKTDLVSPETAKRLFEEAIANGVLDLISETAPKGASLEIRTSIAGTAQTATAPLSIPSCFDWNRTRWVNRLRWEKVHQSLKAEAKIYDYLKRKDIVLVNE